MRPPPPAPGAELSVLVDIGSAWTKASVIGRSRGRWRIAAHAAQPTSWDERELWRTLAAHLAAGADRRLHERLERLVAEAPRIECHTPRRPARLALAAVSRDISGAAARRAAESAGWVVEEVASMDDDRSLAARLGALQSAGVDAWLVSGGFDDAHSEQALEMAALVAAARRGGETPVIWAGSARLGAEVGRLFEPAPVSLVANPRPSPDRSEPTALRHHLEALLQEMIEPGGSIHLAPISFRRAIAALAETAALRILGIDIGARYANWVVADSDGSAESRIFASGGLSSPTLTGPGGPARLTRLIPQSIDELAVADALQNLRARPGTVPQTEEELAVTHGALRALLAQMAVDETPRGVDLIIGGGRTLASIPNPGLAAQLLLDGLRPLGVTQLAIDPSGALGPLGSLDDVEIGEGIATVRDDLIVPLGTSIVCRGGRAGQVAMRVTVHRTGWPEVGPVEVRSGSVQILPLGRGQTADVEITLDGDASLGTPRRTRHVRTSVQGGSVGLVLDARDVPLVVPRRSDDRRSVQAAWRDVFLREPMQAPGRVE